MKKEQEKENGNKQKRREKKEKGSNIQNQITTIKRAEKVSDEVLRQRIFESIDDNACLACEG